MTDDDKIVAASGWCAPSETLYDSEDWARATADAAVLGSRRLTDFPPPPPITLPDLAVSRGPMVFDHTPAAMAAAEAMRARVNRLATQMAQQRDEVIGRACVTALANNWDVHIWPHHEHQWTHRRDSESYVVTHRIGIEFRPAQYPIPTIVEHEPYDATYDWDDD